jgi:uncharacterized membrane protein YkvA (DUF1232 family)
MPFERLKQWARSLKTEIYALYFACRDTRVPWYARLLAVCVVGYAFSPIDLIPDPIPILGYLDDLILLPIGIWLALKMIPQEVMTECREKARNEIKNKPTNRVAAFIIIAIWIALAALSIYFVNLGAPASCRQGRLAALMSVPLASASAFLTPLRIC